MGVSRRGNTLFVRCLYFVAQSCNHVIQLLDSAPRFLHAEATFVAEIPEEHEDYLTTFDL